VPLVRHERWRRVHRRCVFAVRKPAAAAENVTGQVSDNDWEKITKGEDSAIKKWVKDQLKGRSCTVVLVGGNTKNCKWINYEIIRSRDEGMGVVGIRNLYGYPLTLVGMVRYSCGHVWA
jgi:hypothetical protein